MKTREPLRRVLLFAWIAIGSAACDPVVNPTGTVRDPAGVPLEHVRVTLETQGRSASRETSKDGTFDVGIVGADPRKTQISFEKPGYTSITQPLGSEDRPVLTITLAPKPAAP